MSPSEATVTRAPPRVGHSCLVFDDEPTFEAAAHDFLGTARHAGNRVVHVAADTAPTLRTPAQLDAYARYEHRVGRYHRGNQLTGMCAFNRSLLGDAVVEEMACLHDGSGSSFQLYPATSAAHHAGLDGELDMSTRELLLRTLESAELRPRDGRVVLEAARLRFIDHNSLLDLDDYAVRRGTVLVLRTALGATARMAALLDLTAMRVEITP